MKILKKVLLIILCSLLVIITIGAIGVYAVWHNELSSAYSIKKLKNRNDNNNEGSLYQMKVAGNYYFDELLEESISNDKQLISFITNKITKGMIKMDINQSEIACSSFTAKTSDGDVLFGRNYDFSKTNTCIVTTNPKGRYKSISTVDLQFIGIDVNSDVTSLKNKIAMLAAPYVPLDGINEKGVSCGVYMSTQGGDETVATDQQTDKPDITTTTMLRMILDYADSVEKAVELVQKYDLHDSAKTSYHYMVADSTGKSAILEWVAGTDKTDNDGSARELVVTYNDKDSHIGELEGNTDYQVITNFIIQPDYYESDEEKPGKDRYDLIYSQLKATNGIVTDERKAMDILASVGRRTFANNNRTVTVHSVIYNLTKKTSLFVSNEHFDDTDSYLKYSIK